VSESLILIWLEAFSLFVQDFVTAVVLDVAIKRHNDGMLKFGYSIGFFCDSA
jgi:hypothetical protein